MTKYIRQLLFILLITFVPSLLQAQEAKSEKEQWTLQECLDYAHENNIQVKRLGLNVESAESNLKQSEMARLPNANGSFSHSFNLGGNIDPLTNSFVSTSTQGQNFGISSNLTLFNGSILKNTIAQRDLQLSLAETNIDQATENLDFSILSAYLQILLNKEQLKVVEQQSELTLKNYEQSQKLVKAGVIPAGDLLDIEAQMARDQLNIVNAENRVANAYLSLAQSLDYYKPIEVLTPDIPLPTSSELVNRNIDDIYNNALQNRPAIKIAELNTQIAEKTLAIAEGARLPSVFLNTGFNTRYSSYELPPILIRDPYGKQLVNNSGMGVSLFVSVPIFNRYQIKNGINQAQLNMKNQQFGRQAEANNIRRDIEQAYLDAKGAAKQYEVAQKNVEALKQSLNYAEKRYELGAVNTLDVFTAQNSLTSAELQLQSAKYEYFFRLKILDFYEGKGITLE